MAVLAMSMVDANSCEAALANYQDSLTALKTDNAGKRLVTPTKKKVQKVIHMGYILEHSCEPSEFQSYQAYEDFKQNQKSTMSLLHSLKRQENAGYVFAL